MKLITTGEIMDPEIATSLRYALEKGRVLYYTFVNDRFLLKGTYKYYTNN